MKQELIDGARKMAAQLRSQSVINVGPGTELKRLISEFGLKPGLDCECELHIRVMDANGPDWCEQNLNTIIGWLREEADRNKLPFTAVGARILVKRAISNCRKKK